MRLLKFAQVVAVCLLVTLSDARRIRVQRVRPVAEDDTISGGLTGLEDQDGDSQQVRYYAAQQPEDTRVDARAGRVVLLAPADASALNGLYSRGISSRGGTDSLAVSRAQAAKDHTKAPPVQTIRNYSKVNDDGSFTFGYEAADGSFKEETRGTDCVVRGKYGYVDPDGNKREFTYVSGNPCDPNAVNQEEPSRDDDPAGASSAEEPTGPANYPSRRPTEARTSPTRPSTTLFQQSFNQATDEEEDAVEERAAAIAAARARAAAAAAAARATAATPAASPTPGRARQSTPAAVRITPRPYSIPTTAEPPATTFRPVHVAVSSRPSLYTKQSLPEARPSPGTIDFAEELRKFQLENNVVLTTERSFPSSSPTPSPTPSTISRPGKTAALGSDPIYTTELVYDPASGQYNTVVYQAVPKAQDVSAQVQRQRLQPYVAQAVPAAVAAPPPPSYQQHLVRQQQATLLQQSQQLFAQQQRQLQQQQLSRPSYQPLQYQQLQSVSSTAAPVKIAPAPSSPAPARYQVPQVQYASAGPSRPTSPFYYVSPQDAGDQRASLASGQIDAFLRGHNLAF